MSRLQQVLALCALLVLGLNNADAVRGWFS
jgi:hypothetical protein